MTPEELKQRIDLCTFGGFVRRKQARLQLLRELGNSILNRNLVDSLIAENLKHWLRDTGRTPLQCVYLINERRENR